MHFSVRMNEIPSQAIVVYHQCSETVKTQGETEKERELNRSPQMS